MDNTDCTKYTLFHEIESFEAGRVYRFLVPVGRKLSDAEMKWTMRASSGMKWKAVGARRLGPLEFDVVELSVDGEPK